MKRRWRTPEITQIGWGMMKMCTIKRSGSFATHPVFSQHTAYGYYERNVHYLCVHQITYHIASLTATAYGDVVTLGLASDIGTTTVQSMRIQQTLKPRVRLHWSRKYYRFLRSIRPSRLACSVRLALSAAQFVLKSSINSYCFVVRRLFICQFRSHGSQDKTFPVTYYVQEQWNEKLQWTAYCVLQCNLNTFLNCTTSA